MTIRWNKGAMIISVMASHLIYMLQGTLVIEHCVQAFLCMSQA